MKIKNKILKVICMVLSCVLLISAMSAVFAEEATDIDTYNWKWSKEQGTDNWYFCKFVKGEATELQWHSNGYWSDGAWASIRGNGSHLPSTESDVGMVFKAPYKGMVSIKGTENVYFPWGKEYAASDGVNLTIMKNDEVLWEQHMNYGEKPSYNVSASVREGDQIKFIMNPNKHSGYDDVVWKPSVAYTTAAYVEEQEKDVTYYEKDKNGNLTELAFDSSNGRYTASDKVAYISSYDFQLTENNTFVKRYVVQQDGRCRVAGYVLSDDNRGSGSLVTIYRNDNEVWQQFVPENESGNFDFRLLADKGDKLDVEVKPYKFAGYGYYEWSCGFSHVGGVIPEVKTSTGLGYNYLTTSESKLSDLIGTSSNNNSKVYLRKNDVLFDMSYDSSKSKWINESNDKTASVGGGKVTVSTNDVVVDVNVQNDGMVKLSGNTAIATGTSDGMLAKVYLNDSLIWSNRVGGERSVRFDEPYDVSFFNNELNIVAEAKKGDKLTFTFNCWRETTGDTMDISNIKIAYIKGNPMSKTAKYKFNKSIAADTQTGNVYVNGKSAAADICLYDSTTYLLKADASKLFGEGCKLPADVKNISGKEYISLRETAVLNGNTVWWTADRLVLINEELPIFFGYSDLAEIGVALKEGVLFE